MADLRAPDLILKKRDGGHFSDEEMKFFVDGATNGTFQDCQLGAMMMAMYFNPMSTPEVTTLTKLMRDSGSTFKWPKEWKGLIVDKHSTGGVGDKVSLILAPALAACGVKVPMVSGRGLEFTGGTLDKLEAIPGYRVALKVDEITGALADVGCCIVGQTGEICPADRKLYSIRDVTATVSDMGLITGSIVSKKLAESLDALVLDVKTGVGAFMEKQEDARKLAQKMVDAGCGLGTHTVALVTDMNSPLGCRVGHALEVEETITTLQGKGPSDLVELVITLGAQVLSCTPKAKSVEEAKKLLAEKIKDGSALAKFKAMMKYQGVKDEDAEKLCTPGGDIYAVLQASPHTTDLKAPKSGFVVAMDSMKCARAVMQLGGGRAKASAPIDLSVGLAIHRKLGDSIKQGETWVRVHHKESVLDPEAAALLNDALTIGDSAPAAKSRIIEVIHKSSST